MEYYFMMSFLSRCVDALFDFIFPKPSSVLELEKLTPGELVHHLPAASGTEDDNIIAIFDYKDPLVRDMIWEMKYRGSRIMAEKLAQVLMDVLEVELAERTLTENFSRGGRPVLMPMPVSDKRRNERGYNQIEILCEEIKKIDTNDSLKYIPRQLVKHKHTDPQTLTATKKERLENVQETMHIIHPPAVAGRAIVLIDDVYTTGATFKEAKRALRIAGAKKILCLAIAH